MRQQWLNEVSFCFPAKLFIICGIYAHIHRLNIHVAINLKLVFTFHTICSILAELWQIIYKRKCFSRVDNRLQSISLCKNIKKHSPYSKALCLFSYLLRSWAFEEGAKSLCIRLPRYLARLRLDGLNRSSWRRFAKVFCCPSFMGQSARQPLRRARIINSTSLHRTGSSVTKSSQSSGKYLQGAGLLGESLISAWRWRLVLFRA